MSQLKISVSAKADAMIAQLQKEIFNRRRKKITAEGVVAVSYTHLTLPTIYSV